MPNRLLKLLTVASAFFMIGICGADDAHSEDRIKDAEIAIDFIDVESLSQEVDSGIAWKKSLHVPKITSENEELSHAINDELKQLIDSFSCLSKGDEEFNSSLTYQTNGLIGFRYAVMAQCKSMPGPFSRMGGITLSVTTGKRLFLSEEVRNEATLAALTGRVLGEAGFELDHKNTGLNSICPSPKFSGELYLVNDKVVFLEFFSEHADTPCEIEIQWSREELNKYLRVDSSLAY